MVSIALSVKDAHGEPLEAIVDWVKSATGLQWTAALWANGYLAHVVSGDAKKCADIALALQESIIFSDFRVPPELAA